MSGGVVVSLPWRCAHCQGPIAAHKHRSALHIGKRAPELLDTRIGLLVRAVLVREKPCETKLAQAGRNRG